MKIFNVFGQPNAEPNLTPDQQPPFNTQTANPVTAPIPDTPPTPPATPPSKPVSEPAVVPPPTTTSSDIPGQTSTPSDMPPGHSATPSDMVRQTTPQNPDIAGHSATSPDMTPDTARHSAPPPGMSQSMTRDTPRRDAVEPTVAGFMSLDDVTRAFEKAGVIRARRTFQRYCETGLLECTKFDTANGPQYFVAEHSVPRAIESVKALEVTKNRNNAGMTAYAPAPTAAPAPAPVQPAPVQAPAAQTDSGLNDPAMARYIARLEHDLDRAEEENDTKNKMINTLLDRNRETNTLIHGLQGMMRPLLDSQMFQGSGALELGEKREARGARDEPAN